MDHWHIGSLGKVRSYQQFRPVPIGPSSWLFTKSATPFGPVWSLETQGEQWHNLSQFHQHFPFLVIPTLPGDGAVGVKEQDGASGTQISLQFHFPEDPLTRDEDFSFLEGEVQGFLAF